MTVSESLANQYDRAHVNNFNISIWYIALAGIVDEKAVQTVACEYDRVRQCLIHSRDTNYRYLAL